MSTPSYFPVENMQYLCIVWKLVSISLHQIIFMCKICNIYAHDLKLVSICRHQIIFMWKTCTIYTYRYTAWKLVSISLNQIIFMWKRCKTFLHIVWNWYRYLYTKLFSCAKYAIHVLIHMVWKWYRYVGTKLFACGIHAIFIHIVWKLVSKRWNKANTYVSLHLNIFIVNKRIYLFLYCISVKCNEPN